MIEKLFRKYVLTLPDSKPVRYRNNRSLEAAQINRIIGNYGSETNSINDDIIEGGSRVRSRARQLMRNNPFIRGARSRNKVNVAGSEGFILQSKVKNINGDLDEKINGTIEEGFREFSKREFVTMSGVLSFVRVQWLLIEHLIRDGEFLIRLIRGNNRINKFGFSLEILEPDLLDLQLNKILENGNSIVAGVELNQWRRPINYYFKRNLIEDELNPAYKIFQAATHTIIPANDIIHVFDPEHSNQFRGYSQLTQSMLPMHDLQTYIKDAVINAKAGAATVGFIETAKDAEDYDGDETDSDGNVTDYFETGSIRELPVGKKFVGFDPDYPHEQFPQFIKAVLRMIAVGLDLNYNSWIGDLEGVNYSSMRSGLQDERDNWKLKQVLFREGFLIPMFEEWLKQAILNKYFNFDFKDFERLNKPFFIGRRWDWVDPLKDVRATIEALDNNLTTLTDELAKRGEDFDEKIAQRIRETKKLIELKKLQDQLNPPNENSANKKVKKENDPEENDPEEKSFFIPTNGKHKFIIHEQ